MPYLPTPEKLQALGYALHRRKKAGNYYAHVRCRGGSGSVGYSIGVMNDGVISLNDWQQSATRWREPIASEAEFEGILRRFAYPTAP